MHGNIERKNKKKTEQPDGLRSGKLSSCWRKGFEWRKKTLMLLLIKGCIGK